MVNCSATLSGELKRTEQITDVTDERKLRSSGYTSVSILSRCCNIFVYCRGLHYLFSPPPPLKFMLDLAPTPQFLELKLFINYILWPSIWFHIAQLNLGTKKCIVNYYKHPINVIDKWPSPCYIFLADIVTLE